MLFWKACLGVPVVDEISTVISLLISQNPYNIHSTDTHLSCCVAFADCGVNLVGACGLSCYFARLREKRDSNPWYRCTFVFKTNALNHSAIFPLIFVFISGLGMEKAGFEPAVRLYDSLANCCLKPLSHFSQIYRV